MDFLVMFIAATGGFAGGFFGALAMIDGERVRRMQGSMVTATNNWVAYLHYRSTGIMKRTIKIELKADLDDEQYEALKQALKSSLRMILATTSMLGTSPPSIAMMGSDWFTPNEEIEFDPEAEDEY